MQKYKKPFNHHESILIHLTSPFSPFRILGHKNLHFCTKQTKCAVELNTVSTNQTNICNTTTEDTEKKRKHGKPVRWRSVWDNDKTNTDSTDQTEMMFLMRFKSGIGERSFGYRRTIVCVQAIDGKTAVFSLYPYGFDLSYSKSKF